MATIPDHDLDVERLVRITHLALGLHSRIPPCCVRFYVLTPYADIKALNEQRAKDFPNAGPDELGQGYVMCPKCWRQHTVTNTPYAQMHTCNPNDPLCQLFIPPEDLQERLQAWADEHPHKPEVFSREKRY